MLRKGPGSAQANYNELMKPVLSPGRHKAIQSLAKKHGISYEAAQAHQAKRIAESRLNKK